eukprot:scaffold127425_cov26-Attheya_sp.AAC.1
MSFIGFTIFYVRWIPYFELRAKPMHELISAHPIDHNFEEAVGLGFALCQPDNSKEALEAMKQEDEGGECEFNISITNKLRLLLVALGSRKTVGNKVHLHSHSGESLAATWGITSNRHFLWGRPFTLCTDCRALLWLMNYNGQNHAFKRLQMELFGYWWMMANM